MKLALSVVKVAVLSKKYVHGLVMGKIKLFITTVAKDVFVVVYLCLKAFFSVPIHVAQVQRVNTNTLHLRSFPN